MMNTPQTIILILCSPLTLASCIDLYCKPYAIEIFEWHGSVFYFMEVLHAALPEEIPRERKTVLCKRSLLFVLHDCHCAKPVNTLWTCFC